MVCYLLVDTPHHRVEAISSSALSLLGIGKADFDVSQVLPDFQLELPHYLSSAGYVSQVSTANPIEKVFMVVTA